MGAWGEGPRDSDQALDWLYEPAGALCASIWRLIHKFDREGGDWYYHELRAAADLYCRVDLDGISVESDIENPEGEHLRDMLRSRLEMILKDTDWIYGWSDPNEIREAIQGQIDKLKGETMAEKTQRLEAEVGQ